MARCRRRPMASTSGFTAEESDRGDDDGEFAHGREVNLSAGNGDGAGDCGGFQTRSVQEELGRWARDLDSRNTPSIEQSTASGRRGSGSDMGNVMLANNTDVIRSHLAVRRRLREKIAVGLAATITTAINTVHCQNFIASATIISMFYSPFNIRIYSMAPLTTPCATSFFLFLMCCF